MTRQASCRRINPAFPGRAISFEEWHALPKD